MDEQQFRTAVEEARPIAYRHVLYRERGAPNIYHTAEDAAQQAALEILRRGAAMYNDRKVVMGECCNRAWHRYLDQRKKGHARYEHGFQTDDEGRTRDEPRADDAGPGSEIETIWDHPCFQQLTDEQQEILKLRFAYYGEYLGDLQIARRMYGPDATDTERQRIYARRMRATGDFRRCLESRGEDFFSFFLW